MDFNRFSQNKRYPKLISKDKLKKKLSQFVKFLLNLSKLTMRKKLRLLLTVMKCSVKIDQVSYTVCLIAFFSSLSNILK